MESLDCLGTLADKALRCVMRVIMPTLLINAKKFSPCKRPLHWEVRDQGRLYVLAVFVKGSSAARETIASSVM